MFSQSEELAPTFGYPKQRIGSFGETLPPVENIYEVYDSPESSAKLPVREKDFASSNKVRMRLLTGKSVGSRSVMRPRYADGYNSNAQTLSGVGLGKLTAAEAQAQKLEMQRAALAAKLERERMVREAKLEAQRQQLEIQRQKQEAALAKKRAEQEIALTKWREAQARKERVEAEKRQYTLERERQKQTYALEKTRAPWDAKVAMEKTKADIAMRQSEDLRSVLQSQIDMQRMRTESEYNAQLAIANQMMVPRTATVPAPFYAPQTMTEQDVLQPPTQMPMQGSQYPVVPGYTQEEVLRQSALPEPSVHPSQFFAQEYFATPLGPAYQQAGYEQEDQSSWW